MLSVLSSVLSLAVSTGPAVAAAKNPEVLITFNVTLPDGRWVRATSPELGVASISHEGVTLMISPRVIDATRGIVSFSVFRPSKGPAASEDIVEHEKGSAAAITQTSPSLEISVLGLRERSAGDSTLAGNCQPAASGSEGVHSLAGKCCVTCERTTACGCAVVLDCDQCCTNPCCGN